MLHSSPRVFRRAAVAGLVALALVAAACGSDDDASSATDAPPATDAVADTEPAAPEPASTEVVATGTPVATDAPIATDAPATTLPPLVVPDGTTLRVGDQQGTLELPLKSSGLIDEVQSSVEYSTFAGGPPLLEAFNAGALDLGYVGDTPPILAQARDQDIVIVAAWHFDGKVMAVVAPPGKEISSVADLAGKKFAYPTGTALQAFALRALEEVGLTEADLDGGNVDVPAVETIGVLQSGDVDAAVLIEPLLTAYLADNPDATVVRDADGLTTGLQLLITTSEVLADPAKAAAIGDYVANLAESFVWRTENPDAFLQSFADLNQITLEQAQEIADRNGTQLFGLLDDSVVEPLQSLADLFHSAAVIPEELDVSEIFDDRFNPYVEPYTTR